MLAGVTLLLALLAAACSGVPIARPALPVPRHISAVGVAGDAKVTTLNVGSAERSSTTTIKRVPIRRPEQAYDVPEKREEYHPRRRVTTDNDFDRRRGRSGDRDDDREERDSRGKRIEHAKPLPPPPYHQEPKKVASGRHTQTVARPHQRLLVSRHRQRHDSSGPKTSSRRIQEVDTTGGGSAKAFSHNSASSSSSVKRTKVLSGGNEGTALSPSHGTVIGLPPAAPQKVPPTEVYDNTAASPKTSHLPPAAPQKVPSTEVHDNTVASSKTSHLLTEQQTIEKPRHHPPKQVIKEPPTIQEPPTKAPYYITQKPPTKPIYYTQPPVVVDKVPHPKPEKVNPTTTTTTTSAPHYPKTKHESEKTKHESERTPDVPDTKTQKSTDVHYTTTTTSTHPPVVKEPSKPKHLPGDKTSSESRTDSVPIATKAVAESSSAVKITHTTGVSSHPVKSVGAVANSHSITASSKAKTIDLPDVHIMPSVEVSPPQLRPLILPDTSAKNLGEAPSFTDVVRSADENAAFVNHKLATLDLSRIASVLPPNLNKINQGEKVSMVGTRDTAYYPKPIAAPMLTDRVVPNPAKKQEGSSIALKSTNDLLDRSVKDDGGLEQRYQAAKRELERTDKTFV